MYGGRPWYPKLLPHWVLQPKPPPWLHLASPGALSLSAGDLSLLVGTAVSHVQLQHTVWQKLLTGRELLTQKFHEFILKNARKKKTQSQVAKDLRARM